MEIVEININEILNIFIVLYFLFSGMNKLLSSLKSTEKTNPFVRFALKVREFWSLGNYKRFFNMACNPDSSIPYETESCSMQACRLVLSWSLERERKLAAKKILMTCVVIRTHALYGLIFYTFDLVNFICLFGKLGIVITFFS